MMVTMNEKCCCGAATEVTAGFVDIARSHIMELGGCNCTARTDGSGVHESSCQTLRQRHGS